MNTRLDPDIVFVKQAIHYWEELPSAKILVVGSDANIKCRIPKDKIIVITNSVKLSALEEMIIEPGTTVFFSQYSRGSLDLYKPEVLNICVKHDANTFPTYLEIVKKYIHADPATKTSMEAKQIEILNELPKEPKPSIQSLTEHTKFPVEKVKENREDYLRRIVTTLNKKLQLLAEDTQSPFEGAEVFVTDKLTEAQANMVHKELRRWYKDNISVAQRNEGWYVKYTVPISA